MSEKKTSIMTKIFSITGIIVFAKVLGFVKQLIVAACFGATQETDLINLAQGLIGNLEYLFMQIILIAFVTVYISVRNGNGASGRLFVHQARTLFILVGVLICVVTLLSADVVAKALAPMYSDNLKNQLAMYLRLFSPVLVFYMAIAVDKATLNSNEKYSLGELIGGIQSVTTIVCVIILRARYGVFSLVIGFMLGGLINSAYLAVVSRDARGKFSKEGCFFWKSDAIREMLRLSGPLLVSYSLVYVNQQVDKSLASGLAVGTVTAMGNAAVLSGVVTAVAYSLMMIHYTRATNYIVKKQKENAARITELATVFSVMILFPVTLFTMICSDDISSIVFLRGAYDESSVSLTSVALVGYAPLFLFDTLRVVYEQYHYAYKESKFPMINSSIGIVVNIAFSIVLSRYYGVFGITLSTSIASFITATLNMFTVKRFHKEITYRALCCKVLGLIPAFFISVFAAKWVRNYMSVESHFLRLLIVFAAFITSYTLFAIPIMLNVIKSLVKRDEISEA